MRKVQPLPHKTLDQSAFCDVITGTDTSPRLVPKPRRGVHFFLHRSITRSCSKRGPGPPCRSENIINDYIKKYNRGLSFKKWEMRCVLSYYSSPAMCEDSMDLETLAYMIPAQLKHHKICPHCDHGSSRNTSEVVSG